MWLTPGLKRRAEAQGGGGVHVLSGLLKFRFFQPPLAQQFLFLGRDGEVRVADAGLVPPEPPVGESYSPFR